MCNELILSTDTDLDMTGFNTTLLVFSKDLSESPFIDKLQFDQKWYVGSRQGCSCGFRHMTNPDLGFGPPEDWNPEEPEDILATIEFVKVVRLLLSRGHSVDCVDYWFTSPISEYHSLNVNLASLVDQDFRFFENYHFTFSDQA
jgi:hypothetical protein